MLSMFAGLMLISSSSVVAAPQNQVPTGENFQEWIAYIQAGKDEETWKKIPWRNGFIKAVDEAKKLQRPVLLWAMNGNPCGET